MYGPIDHKGKTSTDNAACEYEDGKKKKKGAKSNHCMIHLKLLQNGIKLY